MLRIRPFVDEAGEYAVIYLAGEVDLTSRHELLESCESAIARLQVPHLLVEVGRVTFMDSAGLDTLLTVLRIVEPHGGTVTLLGAHERIRRLLQIVGLDALINVMPDEWWTGDRLAHGADQGRVRHECRRGFDRLDGPEM